MTSRYGCRETVLHHAVRVRDFALCQAGCTCISGRCFCWRRDLSCVDMRFTCGRWRNRDMMLTCTEYRTAVRTFDGLGHLGGGVRLTELSGPTMLCDRWDERFSACATFVQGCEALRGFDSWSLLGGSLAIVCLGWVTLNHRVLSCLCVVYLLGTALCVCCVGRP